MGKERVNRNGKASVGLSWILSSGMIGVLVAVAALPPGPLDIVIATADGLEHRYLLARQRACESADLLCH